MFKNEVNIFSDLIKSTLEPDKGEQINRKLTNLKNLSKTMSDLIKNVV